MAKRRLTQQQTARIAKRRRPADLGLHKDEENGGLGAEHEGLVIGRLGIRVDVEDLSCGEVVRCHLRANLGDIVAGDRVVWRSAGTTGVITAVLPRQAELHRPDSFGKLKLVAANLTRACITFAAEPAPHQNLIDRYLVVAEHLKLQPLLIINKSDLLQEGHPLWELINVYRQFGYPVRTVSAHSRQGLEDLQAELAEGISLFAGQSGVGKSSIIQALLPEESLKIGGLSEQVRKGRHTTTHARLYHFAGGGACIDSPGIREFGLWHLTPDQVANGFLEFRPFIAQCRFRNCSHDHEPGCALLKAIEQGLVSESRYQSYRQIVAQLGSVTMQS